MDAVVQLIRNAMCCLKDLNILSDSFLYDANFTAKLYNFPAPHMSKTTPLELLISLSQLYACVSCTISGYKLLTNQGVYKLSRLTRVLMEVRQYYTPEKKKDAGKDESKEQNKNQDKAPLTAKEIITASLLSEADSGLRSTFVGVCVLCIGISFFWLFSNSLHITEAGWIGGLPALIHALTVMEVALVPLLYLMIKDASKAFKKSSQIKDLVNKYKGKKQSDMKEPWIDIDTYSLLIKDSCKWEPFWANGPTSAIDITAEQKMIVKEIESIEREIESKSSSKSDAVILTTTKALALEEISQMSAYEGYREYIYFILNFIAFYGYLLGVLVYYSDDEENQHEGVRSLKMGYSNADADWTGNFAGDLMWTIEPVVIILSPFVLHRLARSGKKVKAD